MSNVHILHLHNLATQKIFRDEDCLRKILAHQSLHVRLAVSVARAGEE